MAPKESGRRVNAHDVARAAGVSQSTVSLVYRGGDAARRISPETQLKVRTAGDELGYVPHHAARALRQQRTNLLGYASTVATTWITSWLPIVRAAARQAGRTLVLLPAEDEEALLQSLDLVSRGVIDGLVLNLPTPAVRERAERIREQGGAVVATGSESGRIPAVVPDLARAGQLAAAHLHSLGHHNAAVVGVGSGRDPRIQGFLDAWPGPGRATLRLLGAGSFEDGLRAAHTLDEEGVLDRVTALFAFQDDLATGLMAGLHDLGRRVPDDLSIVGCNNATGSAYLRPALTTIDLNGADLAVRSVTALATLLDGGEPPRTQTAAAELIVRQSSGPGPVSP